MRILRAGLLPILVLAMTGCATQQKKTMSANVPNDKWWDAATASPDTTTRNLAKVRVAIQAASGQTFSLGISPDQDVNAHALKQGGKSLIVLTGGFLKQFGDDPDVLANVMGHELAHHALGHTKAGYKQNRDTTVEAVSTAVGMISSFFIPFSGLLVGNAVKAAGLSYSRDDERDADQKGMDWAIQAGYSVCGSYRFAYWLNEANQGATLLMLSSHPGNNERMDTAKNRGLLFDGTTCDKPVVN